ncbi:hypothetical protein K505DRAFT_120339 [Melanomma pulvis-pyrius CBS 109.77]|uniref:Uncharacterized protein n=1 Tax=Melanomma pulvis-pyrius CBS 109.77 TaxID=1314802 RepID=A0A6A6WVC1_9PLEO|nr:hypothetical protein K505DRAFT_120339 [Melanomma pulvis-pyrius CBS 109.77]
MRSADLQLSFHFSRNFVRSKCQQASTRLSPNVSSREVVQSTVSAVERETRYSAVRVCHRSCGLCSKRFPIAHIAATQKRGLAFTTCG